MHHKVILLKSGFNRTDWKSFVVTCGLIMFFRSFYIQNIVLNLFTCLYETFIPHLNWLNCLLMWRYDKQPMPCAIHLGVSARCLRGLWAFFSWFSFVCLDWTVNLINGSLRLKIHLKKVWRAILICQWPNIMCKLLQFTKEVWTHQDGDYPGSC